MANPTTCQPLEAFWRKNWSNRGNSSTQGGHQVAQKLTNRGLPRRDCMASVDPAGVSKLSGHNAAASCETGSGRHFHHAKPAPARAAPPATPAYSRRRRLADKAVCEIFVFMSVHSP